MPLYKTITVDSKAKILIWKLEEDLNELKDNLTLSQTCIERLGILKSELHQRQFLSIRHLLTAAGYSNEDLYYDHQGKPHLKGENYISVSHSFDFSGIIISSQPAGIDIEKQREKIIRVANKFTPLDEYKTLANDEAIIRKLTIVWGVKEAVYKIMNEPGMSFLNHIYVRDFNFEDLETSAEVNYCNRNILFHANFLEFEGFTCVYALSSDSDIEQ